MTTPEKTRVESILIIGDSPDGLGLMEQILAAQGFQIESAFSLMSGLIQTVEVKPDLIVLNLKISPIDVGELKSYLRKYKSWSNIPILFLTDERDFSLKQAMELGADELLLKPFELDGFLVCIHSLLRGQSNLTDADLKHKSGKIVEFQKTIIVTESDETDPLSQEQQELEKIQLHNSEPIFWQLLLERGYQIG